MYSCIICKKGFLNGLRIFIETIAGLRTCYVCHECSNGKSENEVCVIAEKKYNASNEFAGAMA